VLSQFFSKSWSSVRQLLVNWWPASTAAVIGLFWGGTALFRDTGGANRIFENGIPMMGSYFGLNYTSTKQRCSVLDREPLVRSAPEGRLGSTLPFAPELLEVDFLNIFEVSRKIEKYNISNQCNRVFNGTAKHSVYLLGFIDAPDVAEWLSNAITDDPSLKDKFSSKIQLAKMPTPQNSSVLIVSTCMRNESGLGLCDDVSGQHQVEVNDLLFRQLSNHRNVTIERVELGDRRLGDQARGPLSFAYSLWYSDSGFEQPIVCQVEQDRSDVANFAMFTSISACLKMVANNAKSLSHELKTIP
jgi:hypothetical protein